MSRRHLVELEDLPWLPGPIRDAATTYLRFAFEKSGQVGVFARQLAGVLERSGTKHIVDLCSGGGGPTPAIVHALREQGHEVTATLTDRYPHSSALPVQQTGAVSYFPDAVDATRVPERLSGLRTLFNAFHHFRPKDARAILESAVASRQPIAVMELISREPLHLLGLLIAPLAVVVTAPFWRPFRWTHLLLCWLLPIVPLVVLWDGIVSWLRIYDPDELHDLVRGLDAYDWDIGLLELDGPPVHASYLIGVPK